MNFMFAPWQRHACSPSLLASYCETLGYMQMRAQKEMALNIARLEAELASRTKSEFLANMSHELRTPLNAIIGFSELIQHLGVGNTAKNVEYAANISDAGHHLLNVISDILDISKIESGAATLAIEEHEVWELVESSVLLVRERIEEKKQRLDVQLAPDLPVLVVDGRRIKQILINLLSNAHKYTPPQGRIALEARRNPQGGLQIAVADSGPGMNAEEIRIALKPFGQVRPDSLQSHGGTGLGLPIATALAKQHGGHLQLTSIVGEGTTVTLILPDTCIGSRPGMPAAAPPPKTPIAQQHLVGAAR
jgi:two-component system cell cycle sensor histidine kinase PleC